MRVLWLCNIMLPAIAEQLHLEASNKEGWLSGLAETVLKKRSENGIELAVVSPAPTKLFPEGHDVCKRAMRVSDGELIYYGFLEDVRTPEVYDSALEDRLRKIVDDFSPEIIHIFGTEYPHTLAMCRIVPEKNRILIGIQGICAACANAYFANLPEKVIHSVTFRDKVRKDSLLEQQLKFQQRGEMEKEAISLVGNIAGRTEFDRFYAKEWNPNANYYNMNETLRTCFYEGCWDLEKCEKHSIFLSQGDYPLKGLHYMLKAMSAILAKYPDAKLYVAGNSLVESRTLKQRIKISSYGKYLKKLIKQGGLQEKVFFLGRLDAEEMKERYLKSHVFVCPSSLENSPNSLGEAMLLGVPCVSADVGGVPSIFTGGEDGILYKGFKTPQNKFDNMRNLKSDQESQLENISKNLANAVIEIWRDPEKMMGYCKNARIHASKNHNRGRNYEKLQEIYTKIWAENQE